MKNKFVIAGLLIVPVWLTACSGFLASEQPAKQTYLLEPIELQSQTAPTEPLPVLTFGLSAVPGLDSDRIQAIDGDARINHYANARWPDYLPEVLSSVIRRSLLSSGRFGSISSTGSSTRDWSLALEVQQFYGFQSTLGTTSRVSAEIGGTILCNQGIHRVQLSASEPVGEERLAVVVKAHQDALNDVTRQLWDQIESLCK